MSVQQIKLAEHPSESRGVDLPSSSGSPWRLPVDQLRLEIIQSVKEVKAEPWSEVSGRAEGWAAGLSSFYRHLNCFCRSEFGNDDHSLAKANLA